MTEQRRFEFESSGPQASADRPADRDRAARMLATDPLRNVALEASAGTGKTRVLVDRYVRLVTDAQVPPANILAITFTRKAAAEMRQRVLETLEARHREGAIPSGMWSTLRDRFPDIAISTIDAFCLSLLHEFPLEAGVDPDFELADETETPRLIGEALDRAIRIARGTARTDPDVALLFADLGEFRLRQGLTLLLDRRLVAWEALNRFLQGPTPSVSDACDRLRDAVRAAVAALPGGVSAFLGRGPEIPSFTLITDDVRAVVSTGPLAPERLRAALDRLSDHVLTATGDARQRLVQKKTEFRSAADYEAHKAHVLALGPPLVEATARFRHDLNRVLARGVRQVFAIARDEYRRTLERQGALDFPDLLGRTLSLLERRDEFSRSRFKLEARYRHVLVDEFQDTSRAQWRLVRELMSAWSEGAGPGDDTVPPSIFIVGDRKQSIYKFRDAEVAVLEAAARHIDSLRPDRPARAAITRSFRSVWPILRFVNDVFDAVEKAADRADAFRYSDDDRFPPGGEAGGDADAIGLVSGATDAEQADLVAEEISRLLESQAAVRDRASGLRRPIEPGDIAILFRAREGHRLFETALSIRGVPSYVYKGLGFFDADEVKDVLALIGYLARPDSHLRAAAFLRSRFVQVSDDALKQLAPDLAGVLRPGRDAPPLAETLAADDRARLTLARKSVDRWLPLADRVPPAEAIDQVLSESGYALELKGPGLDQARENLKKIRALVRRLQNRGYLTLERMVAHFSELVAGGDESGAIVDAVAAVNLMTIHAAKGLEFPVVFVVNLGRASGGGRDPIRVFLPPFDLDETREPTVGVGDHRSDADVDAELAELEESKRLLYVAFTRARDRLYLGATRTSDGRFTPWKGSLGRLLPVLLQELFAQPSTTAETSVWTGPSATHTVRRVRPGTGTTRWTAKPREGQVVDALDRLPEDGPRRVWASREDDGDIPGTAAQERSSAALGSLVHQLMPVVTGADAPDRARLAELARRVLEGWAEDAAASALVERAVELCLALRDRPDLHDLLRRGRPLFEARYSRRLATGDIERGTIDCLVVEDAVVTVVEFKTGGPRPAHEAQLAAYAAAARDLFPGRAVEARLVYA
jgi:ATP-dependent helicase/nuclease subunit A